MIISCCCSVAWSCLILCDPTDYNSPGFPVFHHLPEPLWFTSIAAVRCHPTSSSSVVPFFSSLQPFSASGSFPMSRLFESGGQSIGASASASVLPVNIQDWLPLELTGLISLQSKGLSTVFSSTTVQKYQFFSTQPFFIVQLSHPYMTTGKTMALTIQMVVGRFLQTLWCKMHPGYSSKIPPIWQILISYRTLNTSFQACLQKELMRHWSDPSTY